MKRQENLVPLQKRPLMIKYSVKVLLKPHFFDKNTPSFRNFIKKLMYEDTRKEFMSLKKTSRLLLWIAIPTILLAAVMLVSSSLNIRAKAPALAYLYYCAASEYIFASVLITLCGAALIELAERDRGRP